VSPFFLLDRLNATRYIEFLETDFFDYLEDIHLQQWIEMLFQFDRCPAHYGRITRNRHFPRQWIGRQGVVLWPSQSPDLTGLLCVEGPESGSLFILVNSREQFRNRIKVAVHQILPDQCLTATRAVRTRCNACIAAGGQHFEQYLH